MIDVIYKIVKLSQFKKLKIIQNVKNRMFQVIFIFSDSILIKQIIVSSTPLCCWGKQIFERMVPGGMSNFLLPRALWPDVRGVPYTLRVPSTDCLKSIASHKKCIFLKNSLFFGSLFNVMRHNSSVLFHLKFYMLLTKQAHQNAHFQACNCSHEN